ncbi:MAG: hydroxyphenylacetyl-CoA thioesterase PaaI [Chloroflexi bacterium]|nr:hydroxyphenylacetyl-CoA thioesterase PaaI [Chloroflexota bacterium]MCL5951980.1 hydroxyphenylacetyl-CoA thioesterase PaaI [Chloroflexota bacterium]
MTEGVKPEIRRHLENDPFAKSLGIELVEIHEGYAKCAMTVRPEMVNAHGSAHGGALFSLADFAFAVACNSHGRVAVALEVKINYLEAVLPGTRLIAEAKEEALGGRIGLYHLTVTEESGKIVASCHATAYRKKDWFVDK